MKKQVGPEDHPVDPDAASLDEELVLALKAEALEALDDAEADWVSFESMVWARVDETELDEESAVWSQIVEVLREDTAAALADLERSQDEFVEGWSLRWAESLEADDETVGAILREEVESAVKAKDGAWSAFAHQVMAQIEEADGAPMDLLADQAIDALRRDVDSELDAVAPRFDRDFREGVERRIFRAARSPVPWWSALRDTVGNWLTPSPRFGLAAATAAAVVAAFVIPTVDRETPSEGKVSISAVRFEGSTVTVMPDNDNDGIALVWVTDSSS